MGKMWSNEKYIGELKKTRGGEFEPLEEYKGYGEKILTRHVPCGREYKARPSSLLSSLDGCPHCANDSLKGSEKYDGEGLHREVLEVYGGEYEFLEDYRGWQVKLKCLHKRCGKIHMKTPNSLMLGKGCPHCRNKKIINNAELSEYLSHELGDEFEIVGEYVNMSTLIRMKHLECGSEWNAYPHRMKEIGIFCGVCSLPHGEQIIKRVLDTVGEQYEMEWKIGKGNTALRYDFYLPKYRAAIEYDGRQHFQPIESWGGEAEMLNTQYRDRVKNEYCGFLSMDLLRIPYWELKRVEEILLIFLHEIRRVDRVKGDENPLGSEMFQTKWHRVIKNERETII